LCSWWIIFANTNSRAHPWRASGCSVIKPMASFWRPSCLRFCSIPLCRTPVFGGWNREGTGLIMCNRH
jgi:hypothetical protein